MKKWLTFVITCIICLTQVKGQIQFRNPGFEGDYCYFCLPQYWSSCDDHVLTINKDTINFIPNPTNFVDGRSYAVIEREYPHDNGDASQSLECSFEKNYEYRFSMFMSAWGCYNFGCYTERGYLIIYLGNDSCDRHQLIYKSLLLDTVWQKQTITFTPDSDYSWIIFSAEYVDTIKFVDIALDALSPIYLINANAVHVANRDTVIYKRGSETPCVPLHATSSISTFDTVRWYKLVNDTLKVPVANGFSTTQCLDSSTTFLIGMRDSVMGCAGVEWSWDTVRVWVRDTVLGINEELQTQDASFQLQPNPVNQMLRISPLFDGPFNWEISDALGRSILRGNGRDETLVNVEPLQRGAYLMKVEGVVRRFLKE
ncbi:MAG: T9SS type A sorting domain-containing protein [Chitinophagales bacterium]